MAYIRVKTGPNKGKQYPIADAPLTVGRDENQLIQILDQGVSRAHAEVFRLGEMCFVRDLNSTNGTYVNDVKVVEEALKSGDEMLIGTTILLFEDRPPSQRPAGEDGVEFVGEDEGKIETTTVELKVDDAGGAAKAIGQEVTSRNITLVSQAGRILRTTPDLQQALEKTLEIVTLAIGAGQGFLFSVDPSGRIASRAVVETDDSGQERKVSRTIVNRVRQTGMPLLTSDATLDGRFALSESIILKKIKSVICVPVHQEERVDGLLYFHSSNVDHALTVADLELAASVALQMSMAASLAAATDRLRKGLMGTIRALVGAIEVVDPKSHGHSRRVADFSVAIATQMALPLEEIHRIRLAAMLHNVGMLALHREPAAGADRFELVRAGEKVLTGIEGFEQILPGVKYHLERADGSGGPHGLKNADLPVMARVIIVANAFDEACTHGGPEGKPLPPTEVVKDLATRGGKDFDDDVVKALVLCHRNGTLFSAGEAPAE